MLFEPATIPIILFGMTYAISMEFMFWMKQIWNRMGLDTARITYLAIGQNGQLFVSTEYKIWLKGI